LFKDGGRSFVERTLGSDVFTMNGVERLKREARCRMGLHGARHYGRRNADGTRARDVSSVV
jgi:hypothetical protein